MEHYQSEKISLIKKIAITSWAWSATLGDTSWVRMIFQLRPSISVDSLRHITFWGGSGHSTWKCAQMFLLRIQDRAECGEGTGLHWGGHRSYFLDWVNNWAWEGGTPHIIVDKGNNWGWGHRTSLKAKASP